MRRAGSCLTPEQLLALGSALLEKRDELLRRSERDLVRDEILADVRDESEVASAEDAMRVRARLADRDRALLLEVERALVKLQNGTYGVCEGTGEPIGYERLLARPWSVFSLEGQRERECPPRRRGSRLSRPSPDEADRRARRGGAAFPIVAPQRHPPPHSARPDANEESP